MKVVSEIKTFWVKCKQWVETFKIWRQLIKNNMAKKYMTEFGNYFKHITVT